MTKKLDKKKRNAYWNESYSNNWQSRFEFDLAGGDKKEPTLVTNKQKLFFYYRFLLEEKIIDYIINLYSKNTKQAMDCGCGSGRNALILSTHFDKIDAWDISNFCIKNNFKFNRKENIFFFTSQFDELRSRDEKYDLIFVGGVFMCMSDDEISKALSVIYPLLNKDGILITRDTLSKTNEDRNIDEVKVYRSMLNYQNLFKGLNFELLRRINSANKNFFYSVYLRLPHKISGIKFIYDSFNKLVRTFIYFDLKKVTKKPFSRHKYANQVFFIHKKYED